MLLFYFLKRFYKNFFLFLLILIFILAFGDMLTRLTVLPSMSSIPKLIMLMLPLMGVFAVPIASSLAVFSVIGQSYQYNEVLMFHFLPNLRKVIYKSILIFSLSIVPLYAFLVFDFAPKSYLEGKEFILTVAKEHMSQLEPDKFHYPMANFVIYFKNKINDFNDEDKTKFFKVLLMFQDDDKQRYVMTAREGILDGDILYLKDGSMQNQNSPSSYFATFQQTQISIQKLLHQPSKVDEMKRFQARHLKFLAWKDLVSLKSKFPKVNMEFHARVARIIWQFLFPFLSFIILGIWGRLNFSNLVLGILGTGLLFLFSYLQVSLSKIFWINKLIGFLFLYGTIFFISLTLFLIYLKRRETRT